MYTIHPLAVGFNETDQGIMTYQRYYGKRIILPIYTFAIKGGSRKILVDTGLEDFMPSQEIEEQLGFPIMQFEDALAQDWLETGRDRHYNSHSSSQRPL